MKKTLHFSIMINAPRMKVWSNMLEKESYEQWTSVFSAGSTYQGSWEVGSPIRFVGPGGDGMISEIAKNRLYEFVSIRHLGWIMQGKEDTESPEVKGWVPAYENYMFSDENGMTKVDVTLDVTELFEKDMQDAWPKALLKLKEICE